MTSSTKAKASAATARQTAGALPLAALTLLALVWFAAAGSPAAWAHGKIAFQSNRDGNYEIYVMNADGSRQTRLTKNSAFDGNPSWSPDGRRIAFESDRSGRSEIYVMNADGSRQIRLTRSRAFDGNPAWSRDGRRIAFRSDRDGQADIYVMDADGSDQANLTEHPANDFKPTWSPDGEMIAFRSDRDGYAQIYTMNADGSDQTRISPGPDPLELLEASPTDASPAWSPDGTRIAFDHNRPDDGEIYVMSTDGSDRTALTDGRARKGGPTWSPDGRRIAYRSSPDGNAVSRDGQADIYVMNADGTGRTRLTNNAGADHRPDWNSQALPPVNRFTFGRVIHNRREGTATLVLRTPPGELILHRNMNVKRFARVVYEAGRVVLQVRPRGPARRRLAQAGQAQRRVWVEVRARVTLKRWVGGPLAKGRRIGLIRVGRR
jgi:dipeptidyl aminopeptidase/acylaminoacyl peptidase